MRKLKLFLLTFVALLGGVSSAVASKTVYLQPGDFANDNAVISLWIWGGSNSGSWYTGERTEVESGIFRLVLDDEITSMKITRGKVGNTWDNGDDLKWNESGELTVEAGKLYKAKGYDNGTMLFTVEDYTEPVVEEPAGYTVDFNTEIATSSHDFAVAAKWKHIVQDNDGSYVNYKWDAAYGVNETGGLLVYSQKVGSSSWDMANVYDLLVTPKVSGTIKLKVKAYGNASSSNNAFVQLWSVNGTATEKDTQLKEFKTEIPGYNTGSNTEWVELSYDVTEAQRIGIRAQYVYIDDFAADEIDTTPEAALIVSAVMNSDGATGTSGTNPQFEQQADGNMKVALKVTLTNSGDIDFVAGTTENYTLTLAQVQYTSGTKTYYEDASIAIPEDLAAGEAKTFDVEFTIPYISGYRYWYIRENVTGTTSTSNRYATSVAYESKFVLREAGSTTTSDLTTAQDYGRVSATTTRSFEIYNDGTAPLTIKSITLPAGFTSDNLPEIPTDGLVLAKKTATSAFNVTLPVDAIGDFSGNLTIEYVKALETDVTTKTLAFSGSVLAEGTWFADFNGDKSSSSNSAGVYPEGSVVTSSTTLQFGYTGAYGSYDHYLKSYSSAGTLVMPKLTATAGATLKYDAVKYQSGASYNLKVYVSTDRKTWGEAKATISNSDLETSGQRYTQTLTFDEAGDYYVAFELYGVGLDNVIGLVKTEVAHDVYLKETNLVAEAQTGKEMKPSVKIIPLTNEAADDYTVKYYVDGEAVATGTSAALTASATADKTFTISYTPTDEVTTEHDTYIAFEFTGGTVIATEHQTLKVTNEPKFLFVAASTSVSQNTTNLTTAQAYGKTNSADVKSFKVYNQGTATLKIKNMVAPEGFSVSPAAPFEVAAGESQQVDVTFSAETAGDYAGNLVVTYEQDGEQTYELAFSGTMLDPTKWYANFDNASSSSIVWPAGLVYESSVQTSYSGWGPYNYFVYTYGSTESNNKIITPLLRAAAGDKFSFDVKNYGYSSHKVNVYLSTDRENWGEAIYTNESIDNSDFATIEATIPEAGEYYVGIAMTGVYVDEIYGLEPVAVAHDWKLVSSNIPAEGMQNYTSTATVNVLNLGIKDEVAEDITVTAYVDGVAVATAEGVAIPMSHQLSAAGTQLSVSYLVNKAGTFPVYLEVKAGDYSVQTEAVDVTFAEEIAISGVQVGTKSTTTSSVPFYTSWMDDSAGKSMSDFIYTPEQLAASGISAGAKITSITFVGTPSGTKTISSLTTDAWVAQQAVSAFTAGSPNTDEMTHVNIHNAESVTFTGGTAYEFKIDLTENPIVYDGESGIRIYTNINGNGQYQSINFDIDNNYKNAYYAHGSGSFSSVTGNPVAFFNLAVETATLSGTVKDYTGAAIADQTITLVSENGVQYEGTTDENGAYSINVIQSGLEYTTTIAHEGLLTTKRTINLGGESQTLNIVLHKSYAIVGELTGGWENDQVMTQSEDDVNLFTYVTTYTSDSDNKTQQYKLRADGQWGTYELPSNNAEYTFPKAGDYTLTFTANVVENTLELVAVAQISKVELRGAWDSWATTEGMTLEDGVYSMTLDLSEVETDQNFKLVVNNSGEADNWSGWVGSGMFTAINAPEGWIVEGESGANVTLKNSETGYKTYTVTATWTPSDNKVAGWTLNIAGDEERPEVQDVYAVVGGVKGSDSDAGIFSGNWDAANTTDFMTLNSDGKYEWKVTDKQVEAGTTIALKVIKKKEGATEVLAWYPTNDIEYTFESTDKYDITVTFDPNADDLWAQSTVTIEVIQKGGTVGISNLDTTNTLDGDIYNVGGVRSDKLQRGQLNIVRTKDGKVRKVVIK